MERRTHQIPSVALALAAAGRLPPDGMPLRFKAPRSPVRGDGFDQTRLERAKLRREAKVARRERNGHRAWARSGAF
jgi:hypothetical protein